MSRGTVQSATRRRRSRQTRRGGVGRRALRRDSITGRGCLFLSTIRFATARPGRSPADAVSRTRGANVTWRIVSQPAGPGYVCVGDAAAVLDLRLPWRAEGSDVRHDGRACDRAGRVRNCINDCCNGGLQRLAEEWFQADARALRRMYQDLPHPPSWVREDPASFAKQSAHDQPLPSNRA